MELSKEQIKVIFITSISILIILLVFLIIAVMTVIKSNSKNKNIDISAGFETIQEIVEYYKCKYINDTYKKDREYPTEIDLEFCKLPYDGDESNEEFYNKIFEAIAKFVNYTNFKMTDTKNKIEAKVICQRGKIYQIIINDIEDYFIYMNSQQELTKYQEIEKISLNIESPMLLALIDNNWSSSTNFGSRESIFKMYNIYQNEGIKCKKVGQDIYNIIFTDNYPGSVLNGISVGTALNSIEDKLGEPHFKDTELGVIGYKSKEIYVFFTKNEISIYRQKMYNYSEFWKLADDFLKDKYDFKDFMNELTYIWNDYSEYTYQNDYLFISYPNKGVDVKLNVDGISGIVLYNNISEDMETIKKYLKNTEFISRLKLDNVFEAEKRRIENENSIKTLCEEFATQNQTKSMYYDYYMEKDNSGNVITAYFISKDINFADRELNEPIDTYIFVNDKYFVYNIFAKGIYCLDLTNGQRFTIKEGKDRFALKDFKDNILKYDESELQVEFY